MDINDMMKNIQGMAERMKHVQEGMRSKVMEGTAGGDMVTARMNGAGELVGLEIDREVIDPEDPEMLADLVVAAVNAARKKIEEARISGIRDMAGGVDLSSLGIDLGQFT